MVAQDAPEYRMEIGGGIGLTAYQGDLNGSLFKNMKPAAAVVAKYKMNPRMAWSAQLSLTSLKGESGGVKTWYPELHETPMSFSTSLTDFSLRFEYNFWPFGTGEEYLGARPLTPFIALGVGMAFGGKPDVSGLSDEASASLSATLRTASSRTAMTTTSPVTSSARKVRPGS